MTIQSLKSYEIACNWVLIILNNIYIDKKYGIECKICCWVDYNLNNNQIYYTLSSNALNYMNIIYNIYITIQIVMFCMHYSLHDNSLCRDMSVWLHAKYIPFLTQYPVFRWEMSYTCHISFNAYYIITDHSLSPSCRSLTYI